MTRHHLIQTVLKWIVFGIGIVVIIGCLSVGFRTWRFKQLQSRSGISITVEDYGRFVETLVGRNAGMSPVTFRIRPSSSTFKDRINQMVREMANAHASEYSLEVSGDKALPVGLDRWLRKRVRRFTQTNGSAVQWLEAIGPMTNLEEIRFSDGCDDVTDSVVPILIKSGETLLHLHIDGSTLSDEGFRMLAEHSPRLQTLTLYGSNVSDHSGDAFSLLPELRTINASRMGEKFAKSLPGLPRLERLGLWQLSCEPEEFFRLAKNSKVKELQLSGVNLTDSDLEKLIWFAPQVQKLSLFRVHITEVGVGHLRQLEHLNSGTLAGTITEKGNFALSDLPLFSGLKISDER